MRVCETFLQISSGNHLNVLSDLRDIENEVKVTSFHLVLCLALVPLCTNFSETVSNISSDSKWELNELK